MPSFHFRVTVRPQDEDRDGEYAVPGRAAVPGCCIGPLQVFENEEPGRPMCPADELGRLVIRRNCSWRGSSAAPRAVRATSGGFVDQRREGELMARFCVEEFRRTVLRYAQHFGKQPVGWLPSPSPHDRRATLAGGFAPQPASQTRLANARFPVMKASWPCPLIASSQQARVFQFLLSRPTNSWVWPGCGFDIAEQVVEMRRTCWALVPIVGILIEQFENQVFQRSRNCLPSGPVNSRGGEEWRR